MPGVPGAGGPVPKRSNQKHGHRSKAEKDLIESAPGAAEVPVLKANSKWHPIAKRWFDSLGASGQAAFYEPSDWATAELVAESMSRDLKPQVVGIKEETGEPVMAVIPLKGASLAAYLKAFTALLVTEGDRRRAHMELQRPSPGSEEEMPDVSELAEYRQRLGAG